MSSLCLVVVVMLISHVVHVKLGPKWRDIHSKLLSLFFLQMVNGLAFKLFEHEQYYAFVNICKRFKVLYNFEQFTIPEGQRYRKRTKTPVGTGKSSTGNSKPISTIVNWII